MNAPTAWRARKPNLVFARAGKLSLHRHWLGEPREARNWNLQLSTWQPDLAKELNEGDLPVYVHEGVKFTSIAGYFAEHPELLERYEYIMFPDDDLMFDPGGITRLFKICAEENLTLAQPALRISSYSSYPIVLENRRFKLRYSNYVEPMAPIFRATYLAELLQYFSRWPTGWGHDEVWTFLMPNPVHAAAIIDSEPVYHLRPLHTGEIYAAFRAKGMDPKRDVREIHESFENIDQGKIIYGGILSSGRRVGRKRALLLFGLHLLRITPATRHPAGALRGGIGALARIVLALGYRPRRAHPKAIAPASSPIPANDPFAMSQACAS